VRVYQFRDRKRICYYDISVTQCYALSALLRHRAMTLNALAKSLYLDKSTASRMVDSLERKGYVARATDTNDARALRLKITGKGRSLHSQIVRDLFDETRDLAAEFDPGVRRAAARLISRVAGSAATRFARIESKEGVG